MDIQLFATDEELQDFPESKTDSSTVQDKTPSPKSINLMASDLPRSHSDLPISSRLPERKSKCKSRRDHRRKSRSNTRSKNCIVGRLAAQTNDQLDTKQEIQWVIRPTTPETYLDQLVGRPVGPPPLPLKQHCPVSLYSVPQRQLLLWPVSPYSVSPWSVSPYSISPWFISPVVQFHHCCPFVFSLT